MSAKKLTAGQVREMLKGLALSNGGQRALSREIGCSVQFLNDVLHCRREPSGKLLTHLGLRRETWYVQQ